jgi:hypothetical protein
MACSSRAIGKCRALPAVAIGAAVLRQLGFKCVSLISSSALHPVRVGGAGPLRSRSSLAKTSHGGSRIEHKER